MNLYQETMTHLQECILPFWKGLRDDIQGGYISSVGFDLRREPRAERGCILNSRILYFFSQASMSLEDPSLLPYAEHAYTALLEMIDAENGGVFWSVHPDGSVMDSTKHTYNQAFAIYALSNYAQASGKTVPLEKARELFHLIERRCRDAGGYLEAFKADFSPESNEKLSENGVMATRTMNTLLHVMEAYTELYRVGTDVAVREKLLEMLDTWESHVYNPERCRQEVFFDHDWKPLIDLHSFGHDIETSWLMDRTLDILDDPVLTGRVRPKLISLAETALSCAWTDHGFANESECGKVDETRVWWVQAEGVVGFYSAWQKYGDERYLDISGNNIQISSGIAGIRRTYDGIYCVEESFIDTKGDPKAHNRAGYCTIKREYDDNRNLISVSYYDTAGKAVVNKDNGIARVEYEYDELRNRVKERHFDAAGNGVK